MSLFRRFINRIRGRLTQDEFDPSGAAEFYELLRTTFEPGAMLLAAATVPTGKVSPPRAETTEARTRHGDIPDPERRRVRHELEKGESFNPSVLIDYVENVKLKSPRVVYNLACYYGIAAANVEGKDRDRYVGRAWEYLRQSISRTPPLERRGLMEHAARDPDLAAVRKAEPKAFRELWNLVPTAPQAPSPSTAPDGSSKPPST